MMYDSKLALAVKANKRVLREVGDAVFLPFGCEYSLLIKNLNSVKALVRVWIDGTDVTEGTQLVINPNQSLDLERFIKNGNLDAGNKFKFIERTAAISDHRGNKVDDGLIRVEFEFGLPAPKPQFLKSTWNDTNQFPSYDPHYWLVGNSTFGDTTTYGKGIQGQIQDGAYGVTCSTASASTGSPLRSRGIATSVQNEVGITVEGAVSDQQFHTAAWFPTDGVKHVMVMRVLGEVEGNPVVEPVTVKTKATCPSCGKSNKIGSKFCQECGTGLQIV